MLTASAPQALLPNQQGGPSQPTLLHGIGAIHPVSQPALSQSQISGMSLPVAPQSQRLLSQGTLAQHSPAGYVHQPATTLDQHVALAFMVSVRNILGVA